MMSKLYSPAILVTLKTFIKKTQKEYVFNQNMRRKMGLGKQSLEIILNECKYKKISGDLLCIGKQTVHLDRMHTLRLFNKYNFSTDMINSLFQNKKFDTITRHSHSTLFDNDLFSSFSDAKYHCLDRSTYEGATIIHDMNTPINKDLHNRFDFIFNGSCMDNVFNPVSFIINTSNMLKTGGRIVHIECATSAPGAYLMFSPEWFFSYYAVNNFYDCKVYVAIAKKKGINRYIFDTDLYVWQPFFTRNIYYCDIDACKTIDGIMYVIVIAEKKNDSTSHICPVQMQYLDKNSIDWRQKFKIFELSERPLINLQNQHYLDSNSPTPFLSDHYIYIGSGF